MSEYEAYLDKILNFIILIAFVVGTAGMVFVFIGNLTTAFTGSALAGLFTGGIVSLLYTAAVVKLILRATKMSSGGKGKGRY